MYAFNNGEQMFYNDIFIRGIADNALAMLKKQEESIPVSWLEEKLLGYPELPYAITDGIINVLELWEDNKQDD